MNKVFWIVVAFQCSVVSWAQEEKSLHYAEMIDSSKMKSLLFELASDQYEGRETGEKGQQKAAEFLKSYYETIGLKKIVANHWEQYYPLKRESYQGSIAKTVTGEFTYLNDFYMYGINRNEVECSYVS